jgi:hypothetical protein
MENRKPRRSRFGHDSRDAQIARWKERAPGLGSNRKLRTIALGGSALTLLALGGFTYTMKIFKAAAEEREQSRFVEVEGAPAIDIPEAENALRRIAEEEAANAEEYRRMVQELKQVDLLEDE